MNSSGRLGAAGVLVVSACLVSAAAFTQEQGQAATKRSQAPQAFSVLQTSTMVIVRVRGEGGRPLARVQVRLEGAASAELTTDVEGAVRFRSLRDGRYQLRFSRDGLAPAERELVLRHGEPDLIDVTMSLSAGPSATAGTSAANSVAASTNPVPAASSTTAAGDGGQAASKTRQVVQPESASMGASATPAPLPAAVPALPRPGLSLSTAIPARETILSIPDFIDGNFVGRQPLKESVLGCTASTTTRLLQLRNPIPEHVHEDADEVLYVIAGEGKLTIRAREGETLAPGSLSIVPRTTPHTIERRGKNPLIVMSTLTGSPCPPGATARK